MQTHTDTLSATFTMREAFPLLSASAEHAFTTTITDPIIAGNTAWQLIRTTSKMLREDWRAVGEALLVGRRLHKSDKLFSQWCRENGFGDIHRNARTSARWLAENWLEIKGLADQGAISNSLNHPSRIRAAYGAYLNACSIALRQWVAAAYTAVDDSKYRKCSMARYAESAGSYLQKLADAVWLHQKGALHRYVFPIGCPTAARRIYEMLTSAPVTTTAT